MLGYANRILFICTPNLAARAGLGAAGGKKDSDQSSSQSATLRISQFPGSSRTSEEAAYTPGLDGFLVY